MGGKPNIPEDRKSTEQVEKGTYFGNLLVFNESTQVFFTFAFECCLHFSEGIVVCVMAASGILHIVLNKLIGQGRTSM